MHHGHRRAFAASVGLNVALVVGEVVFGVAFGSIALVADATHNLGDVLGLGLAWAAALLAQKKPSRKRTYGWSRSTILAALFNALLVLVAVGGVAWEAIHRLQHPEHTNAGVVLAVAIAGVVINGASALFFHGEKHDLSARAAFAHLASDAAVSAVVALSAVAMMITKQAWIDPVASLAVCVAIVISMRSILRESLDLALDAVPDHVDFDRVRGYLGDLPGVMDVHDLHIWAMSTTEVALTAHLVMPSVHPDFLHDVAKELHDRFSIEHATLQVELPRASDCRLAPHV